jgi:hypothetical protein
VALANLDGIVGWVEAVMERTEAMTALVVWEQERSE